MKVFDFSNYKEIIREKIRENATYKAYRSLLAEKIGCQKSYFSQVMNAHVHLGLDHAALLAQFWGFSEIEAAYFVDLVLLARSGNEALREIARARLKKSKETQGDPTAAFQWPTLGQNEKQNIYYSSWYWSAIHIIVSVPGMKSVADIASELKLPMPVVEQALRWLEETGLIKKHRTGWAVTGKFLYLPNSSPMNEMHHFNWRQRAISNLQQQDRSALHYSSVFSVTEEDFHKLKQMTVAHLNLLHKVVEPSRPENLVCFNCDLFKVNG